jgi:Mce-associated membrane protein
MTKPNSGGADEESDQPEGKSAAVRVQTDAASKQDTAKVHTAEPVERQANEPEHAENTVGAEDIDEAEAAISDDAEVEQNAQGVKPGKTKLRIGRLSRRSRNVMRRPENHDADQQAEESVEDDSKELSDATADSEDTGETAISGDADAQDEAQEGKPAEAKFRISWPQVLAYGVLPGLALLLAAAGGFLKWQDSSARAAQLARIESVAAAKDSTIALLSYKSDTVERDLEAAKSRLTGTFKDSYSQLINDVVIPGAKRGHISTTASVPAAASVSATANHAVTLLFVNQTAVVDKDPPTDTVSSVRVTLDKVGGRWLISGFDPV